MAKNKPGKIKQCAGEDCETLIRPSNWPADQHPGIQAHAGYGLCTKCKRKHDGHVQESRAVARPSDAENLASLEAWFKSRRPFRRALGQTYFPEWRGNMRGTANVIQRKQAETVSNRGKGGKRGKTRPELLKPCGTTGAYQRHVANKEPIDDACRAANTKARAEQRAKAKAR